jgi:hypothetical protein
MNKLTHIARYKKAYPNDKMIVCFKGNCIIEEMELHFLGQGELPEHIREVETLIKQEKLSVRHMPEQPLNPRRFCIRLQ